VESILAQCKRQQQALLHKVFSTINKSGNLQSETTPKSFDQNCKLYHLTNREKEIASMVCKGITHKTIANALFIAERTVAKHAQNIFEKTRVSNRLELCKKLVV
jgi:DNA-binding NarL/FixJ family response regulator